MDNDLWRWADPDGQQRTVSLSELRAALAGGLIAPNTPVWKDGWDGWRSAHEVPELTSASLGGANGVVLNIPPPPLAMVAVQQEYEAASSSIAPPPASAGPKGAEPPPPPPYIPAMAKASASGLKTQIGGSAVAAPPPPLPARAASTPPKPPPPAAAQMSMPTTIGLPAPPMALGAKPAKPPPPMVEELSDSALLESNPGAPAKRRNGAIPTPANGSLPPPTDPIVHEGRASIGDDALGLPRRPGLSVIFDDIAAIRRGQPPKNKLLLGVLGIVGLSVFIMLIAGIVSLFSGPSTSKANASTGRPSASNRTTSTTAAATSTAAPPPSTAAIPSPPPPATTEAPASASLGDCTSAGDAKLIAPRAVVQSGIEAQALSGGLALAFAASPRDAVATLLDPTSLAPTQTVRTRPTGGDARHVTPMLLGGKLTAVPDVERHGDRLAGRRVVPTSNLIDVGHMDGAVQWTPHGRDSFAKLFGVDNEGQIEALRAVPLPDKKGVALTFRRGNAVLAAIAKGENVLELAGGVSTIAGLGQVGTPSIAVSGDKVMVAWADRAGGDDGWKIRVARFSVGGSAEEATTFPVPAGGLGEESMSPSLASLGGGRFFIAWTEGPVSSHQVRAVAVGTDGLPSGSAVSVSGAGVNAGQPSAVVAESGHGAVAYLAAKGKALEVHATPISCTAR